MKSMVIELVEPLGPDDEYISGTRDMRATSWDFGIAVSFYVVKVDADQDGTIEIDQSTDQIVWEEAQAPADYLAANGAMTISVQPALQYVRAKFVSTSLATQTRFAMVTGVDYS
jgi:hypothetical protein